MRADILSALTAPNRKHPKVAQALNGYTKPLDPNDDYFRKEMGQRDWHRYMGMADPQRLQFLNDPANGFTPPQTRGTAPPPHMLPQEGSATPTFNDSAATQVAGSHIPENMDPKIAVELDKKYIPDFLEWTIGGQRADVEKSLTQLREAHETLSSGANNLSGPIVGKVPDFIGSSVNPEAIATREAIEEIVQRNLRLVLGAQFTEKEGTRLIARAYNPQLQESENAKRVGRLLRAIEGAAAARESAAKYFRDNGTLVGWDGSLPTADDLDAAIDSPAADEWQDVGGVRIRVKR